MTDANGQDTDGAGVVQEGVCPDCGSDDIYGAESHGDTICHSCGWYTEQGGPEEEIDWEEIHDE